ncbi:hypothetical protein [Aporhodopirellula aestuarii]|uniref:Uncharacterized protein n=1 Tax=Aporhodopirellula aestuarii TaxID=2950107 RepID=A0ABT0UBB9_9BACT|nr:hypothetical protein [Aporhodopirellula aestuarii]MCM2374208.1 hypothetical protein [Aporhodopirellula aestuarii]
MNISNLNASYASQASSSSSRPQGPPPQKGEEQLSSALKSIGVDDSTAASVLDQIDEAISALESDSASGTTSRAAFKSAINEVLKANGIDSAEVEEAIQAGGVDGPSGTGGPSRGGRPNGPPPPPRDDESETSAVESALLSSGVDESSTDDLISQIIETLQELSSESSSSVSQDDIRSALTNLFEENGVNFDQFQQSLSSGVGSSGSFLDRVA